MRSFILAALVLIGCGGRAAVAPPSSGAAGSSAVTGAAGQQASTGAAGGGGASAKDSGASPSDDGSASAPVDGEASATADSDASATADAASPSDAGVAPASDAAAKSCGLRIVEVRALDESNDGFFNAPEGLTFRVVVENSAEATGPVVLRIVSDDPRVVPANGVTEARVQAIAARGLATMALSFTMPKEVSPGSEIGFSISATLESDAACRSATPDPFVVTSGSSDFDLETCAAIRQLQLTGAVVTGAAADHGIVPGSDFKVAVLMSNPGPLDERWYPSVFITSDVAGIAEMFPSGLYYLAAGTSSTMSSTLHVDAAVAHGTHATLKLWASPTQIRCRNPPTLELPVVVE